MKRRSLLAGVLGLLSLVALSLSLASCGSKEEDKPLSPTYNGPAVDAKGQPIPDLGPPGPRKGGGKAGGAGGS